MSEKGNRSIAVTTAGSLPAAISDSGEPNMHSFAVVTP